MTIRHHLGQYEVTVSEWGQVHSLLPDSATLVTDSNVLEVLPRAIAERNPIVIPAGENSKTWKTAGRLLDTLIERGHTRKNPLVAVGGGMIGDLVGFAAGTLLRGVPFFQVPTSLLAMVDSSVGGKVGVDLPTGKNLAGLFLAPQSVSIPLDALKTLPEAEWRSGMAEVIKYGLIGQADLADELESAPLLNPEDPRTKNIIVRCITHKARVVEEDEFETSGLRATLNFGHTVGHAIEVWGNYSDYRHGEAIAIGMVVEARIGEQIGFTPRGIGDRVAALLASHGLPNEMPKEARFEDLLPLMRRDKKVVGTDLAFSLLNGWGACKLNTNVEASAVALAWHR
ncbi:MAG: 3-dehydroquinate synthase [Fimbriimonadaceae bacterium]|nr:3-dehydroquinate synthase [Fimbriimonadaceae bacterium]